MPKFTKPQIILLVVETVACLLTFAVMLGLWISDIETILPLIFLGQIVVLAMTFFLGGQPDSTQVVVRPVAQSVPRINPRPASAQTPKQAPAHVRPRNVAHVANPNSKKFGEDLWDWVQKQFEKIANYLKPKANNAAQAVGSGANKASSKLLDNMKQSPALWMGIAISLLACYQFSKWYETGDWRQSHMGMLNIVLAITSFLIHFHQLGKTRDALMKGWKIVWLVGSIASTLLWFAHDWSYTFLFGSILSTICAFITLINEWGSVGKGAGQLTGVVFQKSLHFFKGDHGMWKILLLACLSTLVYICFFYFGGELLFDDEIAWARTAGLVYVLLMLAFLATAIWKRHTTIKTK